MMEETSLKHHSLLTYLRQRVMPILEPLQFDIMLQKPSDILDFSYLWLQNYQEDHVKNEEISSDDQEPDEEFMERLKKKTNRCKGRKGISGEVYSTVKLKEIRMLANNFKLEEEKVKILISLRKFCLFKNIPEKNIEQIIGCMKIRTCKKDEVVIREGDLAESLFLVGSGVFRCEINQNEEVKLYEEGEVFGEIALLYNTKRSSTISAVIPGQLYTLDRLNFNSILRESTLEKIRLCQRILDKNDIFLNMKPFEKCKLIESLKEVTAVAGKYIIREDQIGDRFYIVASGKLVAEKTEANGQIKPVYYFKEGDYFGEISLIRNVPRQASIKSLTSVHLLYIQRGTFKRLLGPLELIMKRNEEKYQNIKSSVRNMIH